MLKHQSKIHSLQELSKTFLTQNSLVDTWNMFHFDNSTWQILSLVFIFFLIWNYKGISWKQRPRHCCFPLSESPDQGTVHSFPPNSLARSHINEGWTSWLQIRYCQRYLFSGLSFPLRSHLPRLANPKILLSHNKFDLIFQEVVNMHLTYETMKLLNLSVNWVVHIIVQ